MELRIQPVQNVGAASEAKGRAFCASGSIRAGLVVDLRGQSDNVTANIKRRRGRVRHSDRRSRSQGDCQQLLAHFSPLFESGRADSSPKGRIRKATGHFSLLVRNGEVLRDSAWSFRSKGASQGAHVFADSRDLRGPKWQESDRPGTSIPQS